LFQQAVVEVGILVVLLVQTAAPVVVVVRVAEQVDRVIHHQHLPLKETTGGQAHQQSQAAVVAVQEPPVQQM
jgi:hypothetical protein